MDKVICALRWANDHGIWDAAQLIILVVGGALGLKFMLFPRRRVRNFNYFIRVGRGEHPQYPLVLHLQLRNYTGRSVVIVSPFVQYVDLRPPPDAHGDSPSGEYEIKLPDPMNQELSEIEYLLRNKENVSTIIPLDPAQTDQEVQRAIAGKTACKLTVTCIWLRDKPKVEKLVRPI